MIEDLWPTAVDVERAGVIVDGVIYELPAVQSDGSFILLDETGFPEKAQATWHTHPKDTANLSVMDYQTFVSSNIGTHFIVAENEVRGYQVTDDGLVLNRGSLSRAQCSPSTFMEVFGIELTSQSPTLWT